MTERDGRAELAAFLRELASAVESHQPIAVAVASTIGGSPRGGVRLIASGGLTAADVFAFKGAATHVHELAMRACELKLAHAREVAEAAMKGSGVGFDA